MVHVVRTRTQPLRYVARDLLRQSHHFRNFSTIALAPDVTIVADVDQLDTHGKVVTRLRNRTGQQRMDTELAPDRLQICSAAFVVKDSAARLHFQVWNSRKTVDQAFGYTVRKILAVGIAIRERQHCE